MKHKFGWIMAILLICFPGSAGAWFDRTHVAIGEAARFDYAFVLPSPDIAKLKANQAEEYNHWYNADQAEPITPALVRDQIQNYNLGIESERRGHLYGAIVGAVRAYRDAVAAGRYARYHLVYAGHYIGDLSMPLHNTAANEFNLERHAFNDGIVEAEVLKNVGRIRVCPVTIRTEGDLVDNIVRIAQKARVLGYRMEKENRDMTREEAYEQFSDSAGLLRGVLDWVGYQGGK